MTEENTVEGAGSQGVSRRTIMKGAAWTVPALMVATSAPAYALSCVQGKWNALGRGKMLSGGLFNLNLDSLASVDGVIASAPTQVGGIAGSGYKHGPNGEGDPDIHANPLSVTALQGVNVTATGLTNVAVSNLLGLVLDANVGAVNQYAFAQSIGLSKGASGYVDNNGDLKVTAPNNYPEVANIDLAQMLKPLLGGNLTGALAGITNLNLHVGAVVGRAILEQMCNTVVNPAGYKLHRDYLLAYLKLVLTSPLLAALQKAVRDSVVSNANLAVDTTALLNALNQIPVLGPVVTALIAVAAQPTVKLTASPGAINSALQATPIGSGGPIELNLGSNPLTITVDVASLLGPAFPGGASDLANALPANSILFVDYHVPANALTNFIATVQNDIITRIASSVSVEISYSIAGGLTTLKIAGTLASLLAGTATITATLLGAPVINGSVTNPALALVGNIVKGGLLAPGSLIDVALQNVFGANGLLQAVFTALESVLNLTVNVQNLPEKNNDPAKPYKHTPGPARWNTGPQALPAGQYDVAALGLSAAQILASPNVLDLFLARGSVGPHTPKP